MSGPPPPARDEGTPAARYQPMVLVLVATCAGILLDRWLAWRVGVWLAIAAIAFCLWLAMYPKRRRTLTSAMLLAAIVAAGAAFHHARWFLVAEDDLGLRLTETSRPIVVDAIAISSPQQLPAAVDTPLATMEVKDRCVVDLRLLAVRTGESWSPCSGKTRLTVDAAKLDIAAGDKVRVKALARRPERPRNPGEFDFAAFHRSEGRLSIMHAMSAAAVQVTERGASGSIWILLQRIRHHGNALLWRHLNHSQAGLASAVLLGSREQIDRARTEAFMEAGTVHLLAISGLHVGILAVAFYGAARLSVRHRRTTWLIAAGLVVLYAMLTDARPPVVRAAILIVVVCIGRCLGRPALAFNSLAAAGLAVLAVNPDSLFQTGTQLSFLAVATLSACGAMFVRREPTDPLDRLIAQSRPWWSRTSRSVGWWFWRLWLTSVVIWIVAMPLVAFRFHLVSLIAVFANPIVWIPIAVALFSGFGVLLSGAIVPPIAIVCGWVCDRSLAILEACVTQASRLPGSHFWTAGPSGVWVLLTYMGLGTSLAFPKFRPRKSVAIGVMIVWTGVGLISSAPAARSIRKSTTDELTLTFLSVGHGCCVIIDLPDGQVMLYDCGRLGHPEGGERVVAGALWDRGIERVDSVVISHADADHYNLLPGLLDVVGVDRVLVSPFMFRDSSSALEALADSFHAADVPVEQISAGQQLVDRHGVTIDVLHPAMNSRAPGDNANSIVLRIIYAGRTILLPGDLEGVGMEALLNSPRIDVDVTMAPHHGSVRSDPAGFSAWTAPEWLIISGGDTTHPQLRKSYEAAGAAVLNTAEQGAIRVTLRGETMQVDHWDGRRWRNTESTGHSAGSSARILSN